MGAEDDEFNRFVVSRWPVLNRLAWLMTGDQKLADELVTEALVPVRSDWTRITAEEAPFAFCRSAVLARAQSTAWAKRIEEVRIALPRHAEPATDVFAEEPAAPDVDQLEERRLQLRRALLRLPARTRGVTLLRYAEQLTSGEVAQCLELAPALVAGEEARGLGQLHTALRDLPRGDGDAESVVRAALADLLETADDAPTDPVARIERLAHDQRRRRQVITAAVAAVLVALLAIPAAFGAYDSDPAAEPGPTVAAERWNDPFTWPVRGSLEGDDAFLTELRQAHGSTNTLYAGVVQDRTVVVLWNRATRTVEGLKGEVGAGARELESVGGVGGVGEYSSEPDPASEPPAFAIAVTSLTRGTLVVLGTPELGPVEISRTVEIEPDGDFSRPSVTVPTSDGTTTAALESASSDLLRVQTVDGHVPLQVLPIASEEQTLLRDCVGCTAGDESAASFAARSTYDVSRLLNLPTDSLTTTVRYDGPVDARVADLPTSAADPEISEDDADATLVVVHTELPGGAVLRSAQLSSFDSRGGGYISETERFVPVDARTVDDPFAVSDIDPTNGSHVQVFIDGAASLAVFDSNGRTVSPEQMVREGSAVVELPSPTPVNLRVETYDAKGQRLGNWPLDEIRLGTRESLVQ